MITIFTIPKTFEGHIGMIQRNAIESWLRLKPKPEVFLCGDNPGVAATASELEIGNLPNLSCNEYGTPLLDQTFHKVQARAKHSLISYVNADIILLSDFMRSIQRVNFPRFLMIGQRYDIDLREPLDFEEADWEASLRAHVLKEGVPYSPMGSDYFVFVKDTLGEIPPFAVGRPGWDNWMIYHARASGIPVIDATRVNLVVHQKHDYRHVRERYTENSYFGPEADQNLEIMGGNRTRFVLHDATYILTDKWLLPAWGLPYLIRRVPTLATLHPFLRPLAEKVKQFLKMHALLRPRRESNHGDSESAVKNYRSKKSGR